jgi:hypothetical protein
MKIIFFNNSWIDLYFFVENRGKPLCLICQKIKFFLKCNFFPVTFVFFALIFLCEMIKYNSNKISITYVNIWKKKYGPRGSKGCRPLR